LVKKDIPAEGERSKTRPKKYFFGNFETSNFD
jgi:hypothetical protein